ncbi:hypothetical protein GCK72_014893 [Caenorhabditis remanei]|uniref:Uncharacterized protein n=1 Tax=Caenorhabditis remanei TaxID=31234 RepID=A0A6A5GVB2_CAERE|nr:hypothetical protein GCK72_014893 [Caenorhabditis remanei]KAF1758435.1 hypothetical protein GCK72_014893 [Caenorhabditis remanei]
MIGNIFSSGYREPSLQTIEKCHNQVKEKEKCNCHKKDPFCNRTFAMNHWNSIFKCISTDQKSMKTEVAKKEEKAEEKKDGEEEY